MLKKTIWIFVFAFSLRPGLAQQAPPDPENGLVNWMTLAEAQEAVKKAPKPLLIDFYTSWCGWCKRMMQTTYSSPSLAGYINTWFYPVKFDAETRDTVFYRDTMYVNNSTGRRPPHEFTIKMLGEKLSYPSTVFLTADYQYKLNTAGYLDVQAIEPLLVYVVENGFRAAPYEVFKEAFIKTFRDTAAPADPLKMHTLEEALALREKEPKKLIVGIGTPWCLSCGMNATATYADPRYREYMEAHFYVVKLDAQSRDSVEVNGIRFGGTESQQFPFNPVVRYLTGGNFTLPSTLMLDEDLKRLDAVPYFITPAMFEAVLHFFGDDAYKEQPWNDFFSGWQAAREKEKAEQ